LNFHFVCFPLAGTILRFQVCGQRLAAHFISITTAAALLVCALQGLVEFRPGLPKPVIMEPFPWITREAEEKLKDLKNSAAFFVHVRGRRRMGKSSTVNRVLESRAKDLRITLNEGDNFSVIAEGLKHNGYDTPNTAYPSERDLEVPLKDAIRDGSVKKLVVHQ
jgi:hypothetical protein